jgi:hypothetical protein
MNSDQEKMAAGAVATLAVWAVNHGGGLSLGMPPEVASAFTTVVSLAFGWAFGIVSAIQSGLASIWKAMTNKAVKVIDAPVQEIPSAP